MGVLTVDINIDSLVIIPLKSFKLLLLALSSFLTAGEIISCLENFEELQSVDLNELSVTLDIFVLTLPPEIEVMADFHHNRSVKMFNFEKGVAKLLSISIQSWQTY